MKPKSKVWGWCFVYSPPLLSISPPPTPRSRCRIWGWWGRFFSEGIYGLILTMILGLNLSHNFHFNGSLNLWFLPLVWLLLNLKCSSLLRLLCSWDSLKSFLNSWRWYLSNLNYLRFLNFVWLNLWCVWYFSSLLNLLLLVDSWDLEFLSLCGSLLGLGFVWFEMKLYLRLPKFLSYELTNLLLLR